MKLKGNSGLALFLIACGALILLSKTGILGHFFGYLLPFIVIGLGYLGIKNNRTVLGSIVLIVGLIMLLGKFAAVFGFLLAAALIVYGFTLLRRNSRVM